MKGSIRRRTKGSWELTIDLGRDANGKRLRKYEHVQGKKADADRRLRELLASLDRGLLVESKKITLAQHFTIWLDIQKRQLKPLTFNGYRSYAQRYILTHLGHILIERLQPTHIQKMENDLLNQGLSGTEVDPEKRTGS